MSEQYSSIDVASFTFEDHDIFGYRDVKGLRWIAAGPLCKILGLLNVSDAIKRLDADEVDSIYIIDRLGRQQSTLMVNEYGALNLVLGSRKPAAKRLRRWLTHEVLPILFRTGSYTMDGHPKVAPSHHLPPPPRYPMQEKPHVSEHLIAVWTTLRQADGPISNAEIMLANRMKAAVTRKWTRYLVHIGLVDLFETAPQHLFIVAEQADKRHAGYFQRLERIAQIMEQRQRRLFA